MIRITLFLLIGINLFAQSNFDDSFYEKTLRFDFYHVGNNETEEIVFNELIEEPIWGGPKVNLVDTLNLGQYKLSIFNDEGKIYSKGFSTLFKEWQTTKEAKKIDRSYSGTVIFPYPKDSVMLKLYSRNKENVFTEI